MGIFKRLFKIGEAETNALIDKLEDPILMTEQGIRDLKEDLDQSLKSLAEIRAMSIRNKNEIEIEKNGVTENEGKAVLLLQSAQKGKMPLAEADRLALVAMQQKETCEKKLQRLMNEQKILDESSTKLEINVKKVKETISQFESELKTLKARAKVSEATKNVNKQLAGIDSNSTVNMLEKMKEKIDQEEALAQAYGELADGNKNLDVEINNALGEDVSKAAVALEQLKQKLALNPNNDNPA